jgi:hypothetical protein
MKKYPELEIARNSSNPAQLAKVREFSRDVVDALVGLKTDNERAVEFAKAIRDEITPYSIGAMNDVGFRKYANAAYQANTHDRRKILEVSRGDYIEKTRVLMDWERAFLEERRSGLNLVDNAYEQERLLGIVYDNFQEIEKRIGGKVGDEGFVYDQGFQTKQQHMQNIVFKDGESWQTYHEQFGKNTDIISAIMFNTDVNSKVYGVAKVFGPNAEYGIMRLRDTLRDKIIAGEFDKVAKFDRDKSLKFLNDIDVTGGKRKGAFGEALTIALGEDMHPADSVVAKYAASIRQVKMWASLGMATLSSIADIPTSVIAMSRRTDWGYLKSYKYLWESYRMASNEKFLQTAPELHAALSTWNEHVTGKMLGRFTEGNEHSALQRVTNNYWRWIGLAQWTDTLRETNGMAMMRYLGGISDRSFKDLPDSIVHYMQQHQIGPQKWEAMRQNAVHVAQNGEKFLIPDLMMSANSEHVRSTMRMDTLGGFGDADISRAMKATLEQAGGDVDHMRRQLAMDLQGFITDQVRYAVLEPSNRTRRFLLHGTQAGTLSGELLRFATMFKSFPVEFTDRVIGSALLDHVPTSAKTFTFGNIRLDTNMIKMMGNMTMAGYVSMNMKNLAKGYSPALPTDWKVLADSMVQGGTMGLYGDLMMSFTSNTPIERMAKFAVGPIASDVATIAKNSWTKGFGDLTEQGRANAKLTNTLLTNMPFQNHALTYLGMNWALYHSIREKFMPGYDALIDMRRERESGIKAWGRPHGPGHF